MTTPPLIKIEIIIQDFPENKKHSTQIVPVETINFKKGIQTFRYFNQNKRWVKSWTGLGQTYVCFFERKKTPFQKMGLARRTPSKDIFDLLP